MAQTPRTDRGTPAQPHGRAGTSTFHTSWGCSYCGSVFPAHTCHLLPDWIALMVARAHRRRDERTPLQTTGA